MLGIRSRVADREVEGLTWNYRKTIAAGVIIFVLVSIELWCAGRINKISAGQTRNFHFGNSNIAAVPAITIDRRTVGLRESLTGREQEGNNYCKPGTKCKKIWSSCFHKLLSV